MGKEELVSRLVDEIEDFFDEYKREEIYSYVVSTDSLEVINGVREKLTKMTHGAYEYSFGDLFGFRDEIRAKPIFKMRVGLEHL